MNIVIISGEIVSGIEFKFIYDRYTSIASCHVKLNNESIIQIYGYDDMADFMYRFLKNGDTVVCSGVLHEDGYVYIDYICN